MTSASAEMHTYYAARAPYYDAVYLKPERQDDIAFLRTHLPERLQGRDVLEVACGTGYWTRHIAPLARRMVATDGTAEPLEFARLRRREPKPLPSAWPMPMNCPRNWASSMQRSQDCGFPMCRSGRARSFCAACIGA